MSTINDSQRPAGFLGGRFVSGVFAVPALDLVVFIIPLFLFLEVQVVGRLFLPDIVFAILGPLLVLLRGKNLMEGPQRTFLLLALLWLCGQIFTDMVKGIPLVDFARGWAKIIFTVLSFSTLYLLIDGKWKRIILYAIGLAFGEILRFFFNPDPFAAEYGWKFGYGGSITWLLVIASAGAMAYLKGFARPCAVVLLGGAVVINALMGYRSLAGVVLLALAFVVLQGILRGRKYRLPERGAWGMIFLLIGLCAVGWSSLVLYGLAAEKGYLGRDEQKKHEMQAGDGTLGILLGGRSEMLASLPAIAESPIIGHGSWAKDCKYVALMSALQEELGYAARGEEEDCLIPTHSHVLGAWVEAGVLGVILWLWILWRTIRALTALLARVDPWVPLAAFVGFLLLWDVLFSPFGAHRRFITTYYLIVMLLCVQGIERKNRSPLARNEL